MHVKRAPYQKWDIGPTERFRTSIFVWFALRKHAKPDEIDQIACPKATLIFTEDAEILLAKTELIQTLPLGFVTNDQLIRSKCYLQNSNDISLRPH